MSGVSTTAGLALATAAAGFAGRAYLLGTRGRGWPSAPVPLRAGLWLLAAACGARSLGLLWRGGEIRPADAGLAWLLALYAVVALVNLARQRTKRPNPTPGGRARSAAGVEWTAADRREPPAWPGPYF